MKLFVILSYFFLSTNAYPKSKLDLFTGDRWKLSKTQKKYLKKGEVLAVSNVEDFDSKQSFELKALAMHPKKCKRALRKLSMLENYENWIDFIKKSTYSPDNKLFTIKADHPLLPFPMIVHIIVDRPTKEGKYPFTFPTGMFRGLKGFFEIKEIDKKCTFFASSNWVGPKTRIPNLVIEIFSETLSKVGGKILIRKTR